MAVPRAAGRPFVNSIQRTAIRTNASSSQRLLSTSGPNAAEADLQDAKPSPAVRPPPLYPRYTAVGRLNPETVHTRRDERRLVRRAGKLPVGSRRQRAVRAMLANDPTNIPFAELPYQCFQEARKVLGAERDEKVKEIETMRLRIQNLETQDPAVSGGDRAKAMRLTSMRQRLEDLKIMADSNDPLVKKRFEDNEGDLNKPIYRYLANKEWRSYRYLMIKQRIEQFHIVPDLLPKFDPTAEVKLHVGRKTITPGSFLDSKVTTVAPKLNCQVFDKGERLVTVVVVDADVPNVEKDSFDYRCHYIATNIPISPTKTAIQMHGSQHIAVPWLVPYAQKGSPYHRMSIFVLQQEAGVELDGAKIGQTTKRENFKLRSFTDKHNLNPIGFTMFRTQWDDNMAVVMRNAGIPGWDVQFKRERIAPLPYKRPNYAQYR